MAFLGDYMAIPRTPADAEPAPSEATQEFASKGRQSFAGVRRNLSEDELKSPGVQKMLLDDIERLEKEVSELRNFRNRFYAEETKCAVLRERRTRSTAIEVVHITCLAIGSVLITYAFSFWTVQPLGWISVISGFVLLSGSIAAKWLGQ
ncbi:MAG: hypothetical protein ACREUT_10850 [Steroidobacteraceae bacterium]